MNDYSDSFRDISRGERVSRVVTLEWVNAVQERIRALEQGKNITLEGDMTRAWSSHGVRLGMRRKFKKSYGKTSCPFGEIIKWTDGENSITGIRGGLIACGDWNFNVADWPLDLGTDGSWLVEISITGVEAATDDDVQIFIPGVVTASGTPTWAKSAYTGSENYTSNTNPAAPGDDGTVIVPVGVLTITGGSPSLVPAGCGSATIGQCAGILNVTRG